MILSVSRRTDIPSYYSDWFINRIKDGFVCVKNPLNVHQISKIDITPNTVDCIVFWTKNSQNILCNLKYLKEYKYYFQFTLTGYGKDIEPNIPDKNKIIIPIFKKLSNKIGNEKVIWRYDPIFINDKYTIEYHLKAFKKISTALKNYTKKVVISFVDVYKKNKKIFKLYNIKSPNYNDMCYIAENMAKIAKDNNIEIASCAEKYDLERYGVKHNCCIDKDLVEKIVGYKIKVKKDKTQRQECGCIESIDIGAYNTCLNKCKYCYANFNENNVDENYALYDRKSPLLCGHVDEIDNVHERRVKSNIDKDLTFFDILI